MHLDLLHAAGIGLQHLELDARTMPQDLAPCRHPPDDREHQSAERIDVLGLVVVEQFDPEPGLDLGDGRARLRGQAHPRVIDDVGCFRDVVLILDLADHLGIGIASGCRAGNCGTCVLAMQSGEVAYIQPPGSPPEARTCLTCIAQPKGNIVLDA